MPTVRRAGLGIGVGLGLALSACGAAAPAAVLPLTAGAGAPVQGAGGSTADVPQAVTPSGGPAAPTVGGTPAAGAGLDADPAVTGLRAYYAAAARAVDAHDMQLPDLLRASTSARTQLNPEALIADRGGWVPGPTPFTPLASQVVSPTARTVLGCAVVGGWVLTAPGGRRTAPDEVSAVRADLVLQAGVWKVDDLQLTSALSCAGVTVERRAFP